MSKPDKPGELQNVKVEAISLVGKAANGERFKIFKSAEEEPPKETVSEAETQQVPEVIEKNERGLFHADEVEKEAVADSNEGKEEELEKSGRKISGSRLTKLKDIQAMLNDVLSGLEENQEVKQMTNEDVQKAVEEAIKPLNERIEKLEQEEKPAENSTPPEQPKEADMGEVVKNAINEAIAPLTARIEKIENARGFSNRVPEDTRLEKSTDLWAGIF